MLRIFLKGSGTVRSTSPVETDGPRPMHQKHTIKEGFASGVFQALFTPSFQNACKQIKTVF